MTLAERKVHTADAIEWLKHKPPMENVSVVASLPDISEFPGYSLEQWQQWFISTASLIFSRVSPQGVTVFYQSDIKYQGHWVNKAYLCQKAAEQAGQHLLWHKIACRAPAGTTTFGRPAYSHLLCFSKELELDPSKSSPDVLPDLGEKTWARGMGLNACHLIARFIAEQTSTRTVLNPFCGEGSMLAAANHYGLSAIGIERSPKRAEAAQKLGLSADGKEWLEN